MQLWTQHLNKRLSFSLNVSLHSAACHCIKVTVGICNAALQEVFICTMIK